jgi:hypothetical protein
MRELMLFSLLAILLLYLIINLSYFLWRILGHMDDRADDGYEFLLFHWILYVPIKKFNDFLNK